MQILRNYYARWFLCAFLVGVIIPPIFFVGWILFEHFSAVNQLQGQGLPVVIVTNPFLDITNPISGKVTASASGNAAFLVVAILCGLCAGVFGLVVAGLNRLIRKSSR